MVVQMVARFRLRSLSYGGQVALPTLRHWTAPLV